MRLDYSEGEALRDVKDALAYLRIFNKDDLVLEGIQERFGDWTIRWRMNKEVEVVRHLMEETQSVKTLTCYTGIPICRIEEIIKEMRE